MKTVIITGGIGSGKSEVCKYLESKGVPVYDCDSKAKELYDTNTSLLDSLEQVLGCKLRLSDGKLDRKLLASIIFHDDKALAKVDGIVHPAVINDFTHWRDAICNVPLVVMESALVLGSRSLIRLGDKMVLVTAPTELRLKRAMSRDSCSESAVRSRIDVQDRKYFSKGRNLADAEIVNDGTLEELYHKVDNVFARLWN
jgi:dephospho-CoA kinase